MSVVVETAAGKVEGFLREGIRVFLGIPFAAPPVGELRWLSPQPLKPWAGVRETKAFAAIEPQTAPPDQRVVSQANPRADASLGVPPAMSEDCLYLNVWTPGADGARRPVLLYLHGGGFTSGTGASPQSNGAVLARRGDVVVVTINYRVNVFGFLRLKDVTNGRIPSTGNEGMLDQVAALRWVRDNIEAFGGDPGNVTIFGISAGGGSAGALLGMRAAKGLFHKAISQSGSAHFLNDLDEANCYAEHFLNTLGTKGTDVDALRRLTMEQVLTTYSTSLPVPKGIRGPMPTVDGEVFDKMPIDSIKAGSADGIPLLAGTTADEWHAWRVSDPAIENLEEGRMLGRFRKMMPDWDMTDMVRAYREALARRGIAPTPSEIYLAIMTARVFWIPTTRMLEAQQRRGNPAYSYLFTWKAPLRDGISAAYHSLDGGFLWGNYQPDPGSPGLADTLSRNMQDAWLSFARTGDPSCPALGKWPPYGEHRETMLLGAECLVQESPFEDERRIWESAPDSLFKWG